MLRFQIDSFGVLLPQDYCKAYPSTLFFFLDKAFVPILKRDDCNLNNVFFHVHVIYNVVDDNHDDAERQR